MLRSLINRLAKPPSDRSPGLLQQSLPRLSAEYGRLLHQHPQAIVDTSRLPASKAELKSVLRMAWQMHSGAEQRAVIENGYRHLARFQDGVGATVIPLGNAASGEADEMAMHWRALAEAEAIKLAAEFEDFKRRCAKG